MRILVVALEGLKPDQILADERLTNLRQLMSVGCYGSLAPSVGASFAEDVVCEQLAQAGRQVVLAEQNEHALAQQARNARSLVAEGGWDFVRVTLTTVPEAAGAGVRSEDNALELDGEIGEVLNLLEDDTAILLLAGPAISAENTLQAERVPGAFVLAAPGYPPLGELHSVAWSDLAPTVLDLAGCDVPAWLHGQSLLAGYQLADGGDDLSVDEETLLRARLAGLGYIG